MYKFALLQDELVLIVNVKIVIVAVKQALLWNVIHLCTTQFFLYTLLPFVPISMAVYVVVVLHEPTSIHHFCGRLAPPTPYTLDYREEKNALGIIKLSALAS